MFSSLYRRGGAPPPWLLTLLALLGVLGSASAVSTTKSVTKPRSSISQTVFAAQVIQDCTLTPSPNPPMAGSQMSFTVQFTYASSGQYELDFGDNSARQSISTGNANSIKINHTYAAAGPILANVNSVTGGSLCRAVFSVQAPTPTMSTDPQQINVGEVVTAKLGNLPANLGPFAIDWGDDTITSVTGPIMTHKYLKDGGFPIMLTQDGKPIVTSKVSVAAPKPTMTTNPVQVNVSEVVTATLGNLGTNPSNYSVDWGDQTSDTVTGTTMTHKYAAPGGFPIFLKQDGALVVATSKVSVVAPAATFTLSPNPALLGEQVTATPGGIVPSLGYQIDWGDNSTSPVTGNTPVTHKYAALGSFAVTLSAPNTPSIKPFTVVLTVKPPTATLDAIPNPALVGEQVTATPGGIVAGINYTLDWGDGATSPVTGNTPVKHAYAAPGTFVVSLSAPNLAPVTVSVRVNPPAATLAVNPTQALVGEQVSATPGGLLSGIAYEIDWGDGKTSPATGTTPVKHAYAAAGVFVVTLSAPNNQFGIKPVTATVNVKLPNAALTVNPATVLVGEQVTATPGSIVPGVTYTLDWGDGKTSPVTSDAPIKHAYSTPSVYVVKLTADGIAPVTATVNVKLPNAGLNVTPNPVMVGEIVTATPEKIVQGVAYTLDWGDGTSAPVTTTNPLRHGYSIPGLYVVKLTADGIPPVSVSVTVKAPNATLNVAPNPALVGEQVTATPGGIVAGVAYTLDWGDGQTSPVNSNAPIKHAYTLPSTYVLKLTADGIAPATASVTVKLPAATLTVSPTTANIGEQVTATPGGIVAGVAYTLDWGDDKTSPVTGNTPIKHNYSAPGVYVVKLNADGLAPATATVNIKVPVPTLDVQPNPALVNEQVTATPGNLVQGVAYTLDWGDGTTAPLSAMRPQAAAPLKHTYSAPGTYLVKLSAEGTAPATVSVVVKLPKPTLDVTPSPARTSETVVATPGTLIKGIAYTLDWGDGTDTPITGPLKHTYAAPGTYVLQLNSEGQPPVSVTLKVNASLDVQALRLHFVKPEDRPVMQVFQNSVLTAALDLEYAGQGHVLGEVFLDGNSIARVDLNARVGASKVTFTIPNLPTTEVGTRTLEYRPDPVEGAAPKQSTPQTLTYTVVAAPTELEIAGFVFKITSLTNPDLNNFAGTGTHTLIVGGVEAFKDQKVTFQNLKVQTVSEGRVKVLGGGFNLNLSDFKKTPLPAGIDGFYLAPSRVSFVPTGATFSGTVALATTCEPPDPASQSLLQAITFNDHLALLKPQPVAPGVANSLNPQPIPPKVMIMPVLPAGEKVASSQSIGSSSDFRFAALQGGTSIKANMVELRSSVIAELTKHCRPDPKYSYGFEATLKPDSGDLYGTAPATLNSVKVPTTPFAMTGSSTMTLDLSAAQSAASLGDILSAYDKAPDAGKPPTGEAWMGVVFDRAQAALDNAKTAPLSASLRHGFTFSSELAAGSFTDRGWTFNMDKLGLVVVENTAQSSDGKATTRLPMLAADVTVNISMKGAKLQYTLTDSVEHNFGKSSLKLGAGVWVESADRLDLNVTGAAWNMKQLSTLGLPKPPSPRRPIDFTFERGILALSAQNGSSSALIGNVPAQSGGQAQSSAMSSSIGFNAAKISAALLSATSGSGAGNSGAGGTRTAMASSPVNAGLAVMFSEIAKDLTPSSDARYEDGVVTLNTLTMTADGNVGFTRRGLAVKLKTTTSPFAAEVTADGLSRKTLSVPDFKMLGQTFNVTDIVLGRQGGNYVLGFNGLQNLNPDPKAKLPGIGVTLRYRVAGGKDRELAVHTDGFTSESDPNARFRTEPSDTVLNLTTLGYVPVSDVRARLGANETLKAGLKQVEGGFELTLNGGLDTGKGAKTIAVKAEAVFGLVIPDPYFYVKASVENKKAPIVTLGTFSLYSFMGGIAYNMKWPDNASVPDYAKAPTRVKTDVIQIIGGAVLAVSDGSQLHMNGIFKIDTTRGFELTVDGWILTKLDQGVFGSTKPQARLLITITGAGFYMEGCVGPQNKGAGDRIDCTAGQISQLKIVDMLTLTGHLWVNIGDGGNYVKIGTYSRPTEAKLDWPVVDNARATAYLIVGEANDPGDRKGGITGQAGFFTGTMAEITYSGRWDGSAGPCSAWASIDAGLHTEFDAGVVFSPFSFDASIYMHAWVNIGAGGACKVWGFGPSISTHADLDAEITGHLWGLRPVGFEGSAKVRVDIPVIPTFTVKVGVKL